MPPLPKRRGAGSNAPPKKSLADAVSAAFSGQSQEDAPQTGPKPSVAWRRSGRGNLTATFGGARVTVFERGWYYAWCISDDESDPRYSEEGFPTEEEAVEDVMMLLNPDE